MLTPEYIKQRAETRVPTRLVGDGRRIWLYPMLFTERLAIGPAGDEGYDDYWCFDDYGTALQQFLIWDPKNPETPEPTGWIKHPKSGRRRMEEAGESYADAD